MWKSSLKLCKYQEEDREEMQSLIISGGSLDMEFALSYIEKHSFGFMIAADRGMDFFYQQKITPDYVVGDFDSADPEILQYFRNLDEEHRPVILQFQPEKDETDTELAMRIAIERGCDTIHLLGATGNRVDHMLGNLHLLGNAMEKGVECRMVDANNRIRMVCQGIKIRREEQFGKYVSLFPFTPQVRGLTLTGFQYPLEEYTLECYHSLGVSNEIIAKEAEISFREGVLVVMEAKD